MSAKPENAPERSKWRVQRHSTDRLLRKKLLLPGGVTISVEKHNGRLMVRVEVLREESEAGGRTLKQSENQQLARSLVNTIASDMRP